MFVLCCIWFIVAFLWITITSALDKEWMIDGRGINNVCDVLMYLEEDDTRDVGVIMTLPLFFPFLWFALWRKKRGWFMYATALAIFSEPYDISSFLRKSFLFRLPKDNRI